MSHSFILILVFLSYQLFLLLVFFFFISSLVLLYFFFISIFFISFMFFHVLSLSLFACLLFLHSLDSPQINTWITIVWNQWFSVPFSVSFSVFISFLVIRFILLYFPIHFSMVLAFIWFDVQFSLNIPLNIQNVCLFLFLFHTYIDYVQALNHYPFLCWIQFNVSFTFTLTLAFTLSILEFLSSVSNRQFLFVSQFFDEYYQREWQ